MVSQEEETAETSCNHFMSKRLGKVKIKTPEREPKLSPGPTYRKKEIPI